VRPAVFLGLVTVDVIYGVDSVPSENEKSVAQWQEVLCGGPAANAAITYGFLGGTATLMSAVGTHPLCSVIRHDLERFQVSLHDFAPSSREVPPVSAVLVSQSTGARTVVSGHATRTPAPAEAVNVGILNSAALLLVDGHQIACSIRAAAQARALGIPVVLDGGSWKDGTDELLPLVQYAICSEHFAPPGNASASDAIAYLLDRGPEAVAITRGPGPITWATRGDKGEIAPPRVVAVDTTGAGDIFHGAFCYQLVLGNPFPGALAFAAKVASYSCRFPGTRSWMATWPRDNPSWNNSIDIHSRRG